MSLELDAVLRAEVTSFDTLDAVGVLTRTEPSSEADVRTREALAASRTHEAALAFAREHTSPVQIAQRIADAVGREDANVVLLYELTRDLELITPSRDHLSLLLQGIADAPPMTHFGNPVPPRRSSTSQRATRMHTSSGC